MKNNILELQHVTREYLRGGTKTAAISDISFTVKEGEDLAIIGPSGSGKSTLLNMIGGLDKPSSGSVIINGQDISKLNDKKLSAFRNKTIGFVFQFFNLQDYLKASENVMIPLIFSGMKWKDAHDKAIELLKRVGLKHRTDHYPKQLSGGEMQRVAIARSLANNPKILLADEPTANLDRETGKSIISLFKEINTQGMSLIVITHDPEVSKQFTRTVTLRDGKLMESTQSK